MACARPTRFLIHKIQESDTPSGIAHQYGIPAEDLYYYNPWMLESPNLFSEGLDVSIPEYTHVIKEG